MNRHRDMFRLTGTSCPLCERPRSPARRGAALLVVMILLLLISAYTTSAVRVLLAQRQQFLIEQQFWQADWLAEAGLSRARARWAADSAYTGEIWQIAAADLSAFPAAGPEQNGEVRITIAPSTSQGAETGGAAAANGHAEKPGEPAQSKVELGSRESAGGPLRISVTVEFPAGAARPVRRTKFCEISQGGRLSDVQLKKTSNTEAPINKEATNPPEEK